MSAPSSRSARSPASRRPDKVVSLRSTRGGAVPASSSASSACADYVRDDVRSVEQSVERREPLELKTTRDERDRARDLAPAVSGLDHRGVRLGIRNSTRDGSRAHHRGSPRSPQRDRFLEFAGALRDLLKHIGRDATWRIALAGVLACVSTQIPLPNDTLLARSLLFVSAVTIGALVGRRLERRKRRKS